MNKLENPQVESIQAVGNTQDRPGGLEIFGVDIEKIKFKLNYYRLKIKSRIVRPTPEEFDELTRAEVVNYADTHPPLIDVFNPQVELGKIKGMGTDQKKEELRRYKFKLVLQRDALATCRSLIESYLAYDPDTETDKLVNIIEMFNSLYGFTPIQVLTAKSWVRDFRSYRERALKIKQRFEDDHELAEYMTGFRAPSSKTTTATVEGPAITIKTDQDTLQKLKGTRPNPGYITQGFAGTNPHKPYIVADATNSKDRVKQIVAHEQQHIVSNIVLDMETLLAEEDCLLYLEATLKETDPVQRQALFMSSLRAQQRVLLIKAKNEILAQEAENSEQTRKDLVKTMTDPNRYTYYKEPVEQYKRVPEVETMWVEKVLIDDYRLIVVGAIQAFERLRTKGNLPVQYVSAILADKPLEKWSAEVRRYLELMESIKQ